MAHISYIFIHNSIEHYVSNIGDSDQTPRSVASDLSLRCSPMPQIKYTGFILG